MNPNKALWEKGDFTHIAASMRESGEALVSMFGIKKGLKVRIHPAPVWACDGVAFRYEPFCEMAKAEIPNKLLRSYTGTCFVFSS